MRRVLVLLLLLTTAQARNPHGTATGAVGGTNLVMYSNGVLNALWPGGQDLSYHGTFPAAWSNVTAYSSGNLVSANGVSGQVYRCIVPNTGAAFPGADWQAINFPDNYQDTNNPQAGHTKALALYGVASNPFNGWQQGSNWPPTPSGTSGLDISAYTQIQFDYNPNTGDGTGIQFHYNRATGNDLGVSTNFTPTTLSNINGAITANTWNTNLKIPLAYLGSLSSYNYYKFGIQRQNAGVSYFDNVTFVKGNVVWIFRGNQALEAGWADASSNATLTYNQSAQAISGSFYALNNPPLAMSSFNGTISGTTLTINSGYVGPALKVGMVIANSGPNIVGTVSVIVTPGTTYTLTGPTNQTNANLVGGYPQSWVSIVKWVPSATNSYWETTFSGGISTVGVSNYTVGLLPTAVGYAYKAQAVDTSGVLMGSSATLSAFTPIDNGVSTSHWTVYSVPLSSMGIANTTIGGIRITDTSGHTNTIYASQDGFWQ